MNTPFHQPDTRTPAITPADSARYTRDMLGQLKVIADGQGQKVLAHLLTLASMEADALQKRP